jgi:hypothetical protein
MQFLSYTVHGSLFICVSVYLVCLEENWTKVLSALSVVFLTKRYSGYEEKRILYIPILIGIGPSKAWQSSNIWEQHLQIKIVFTKRLRAD